MKLKELMHLQFGIVGNIQIMITGRKIDEMYHDYQNLKEAIEDFANYEVIQMFGTHYQITIVCYMATLDHPEHH